MLRYSTCLSPNGQFIYQFSYISRWKFIINQLISRSKNVQRFKESLKQKYAGRGLNNKVEKIKYVSPFGSIKLQ